MKINIATFINSIARTECRELAFEFLRHIKELRDCPSKHKEFFNLYVFGDDEKWRFSSIEKKLKNKISEETK
jgi:hypothetical protein